MRPTKAPEEVGEVCWDVAYVQQKLSSIAQVDISHADWFLATHSPITCVDSSDSISQSDLFRRLFDTAKRELLVVIKGEPGAGKSQLINWLRLRFDIELEQGNKPPNRTARIRTVMIRRRSGSLKDALQQLVEQLPGYERHLKDVASAIAEISNDQARRKLSFALSGALYAEPPKDRRLKSLHQVFNDVRTIEWACRAGGAIDKNILRLTTESDPKARESIPPLTSEDFLFRDVRGSAVDGQLLDNLLDDSELREAAAEEGNRRLRNAIADLTGLRGQTLHEVFRNIRLDMKRQGEDLALFVEDVSTLSVLDEELVNALEPQEDTRLCGLMSVLGMTVPAHERLPDNLKQRVSLTIALATERDSASLTQDRDYADQFVARYLNALRVGPGGEVPLASDVRLTGEIGRSACDNCTLRKECFDAFGSTHFDKISVGLYPLAPGAASRLLDGVTGSDAAKTPRSLLQKVLQPLLESSARAFRGDGANLGLAVQAEAPADLSATRDTLLGGWSVQDQGRLSYLTWYWTGERNLEAAAPRLQPMLPWFRLPQFTRKVDSPPKPQKKPDRNQGEKTDPDPPVPHPVHTKAMQRLDNWYQQGKPLESDGDFRELLVKAVKESLPLEEYRSPSHSVRIRSMPINKANIEIEGMVTRAAVAKKARFEFRRDEENYSVLRALLDFEYIGRRTWDFEGGVSQRRTYAKWLLRNQDRLVDAYGVVKSDPVRACEIAVQFLKIAYRFSARKELPSDTSASVAILANFQPLVPHVLSEEGRRLGGDLPDRVLRMRKFLFAELNVPQGTTPGVGILYLDPACILRVLSSDEFGIGLPTIEGDQAEADYPDVWRLSRSPWMELEGVLAAELKAIGEALAVLHRVLRHWGIGATSLREGVGEFLTSAREVVKACADAAHSLGDGELQQRIANLAPAEVTRQISPLLDVESIEEKEPVAMLSVDTGPLSRLVQFVCSIDSRMKGLVESIGTKLDEVVTQAELDLEKSRAEQALAHLAVLATTSQTGQSDAE